jgi:hypothetical protein
MTDDTDDTDDYSLLMTGNRIPLSRIPFIMELHDKRDSCWVVDFNAPSKKIVNIMNGKCIAGA